MVASLFVFNLRVGAYLLDHPYQALIAACSIGAAYAVYKRRKALTGEFPIHMSGTYVPPPLPVVVEQYGRSKDFSTATRLPRQLEQGIAMRKNAWGVVKVEDGKLHSIFLDADTNTEKARYLVLPGHGLVLEPGAKTKFEKVRPNNPATFHVEYYQSLWGARPVGPGLG